MNGPAHYKEAERLADVAAHVTRPADGDPLIRADQIALAQVHATLALAAATLDGPAVARYLGAVYTPDGIDTARLDAEWSQVTA